MTFDWTLTLGNVLTFVGFIITGITFVLFMRSDIMILAHRVTNIEGALRELVQANLALAEQKGRMEQIDERLNRVTARVDGIFSQFAGNGK